jgi:small nuclear ribonucleoprotein (snRNP)-like protein
MSDDQGKRPMDVLGDSEEENILVELKDETRISGELKAFDMHLNMWLSNATVTKQDSVEEYGKILIRGDNVTYVSPE